MALTSCLLLLSALLSLLTYFELSLQQDWRMFFVPILLLPAFFLALLAALLLGLFLASLRFDISKRHKPSPFLIGLVEELAFMACLLTRVRVRVSGIGRIKDLNAMVAINHLSNFDFIALLSAFRGKRVVAVAKQEIASWPLIGRVLSQAGFIYLHRDDLKEGVEAIEHGAKLIEDGLCSVAVSPEGTRNKGFPNPRMLPFHPGTFALAKKSFCPIALVCIQNTNAVKDRFPLRGTKVYIDVVDVIGKEQVESMSLRDISDLAHSKMDSFLKEKQARAYGAFALE